MCVGWVCGEGFLSIAVLGPGAVALPVPVIVVLLRVTFQKAILRVMAIGIVQSTVVVPVRLVQVLVGIRVFLLHVAGAPLGRGRPGFTRGFASLI